MLSSLFASLSTTASRRRPSTAIFETAHDDDASKQVLESRRRASSNSTTSTSSSPASSSLSATSPPSSPSTAAPKLSHQDLVLIAIAREIESRQVNDEQPVLASFCGQKIPSISLANYIVRLVKYANMRAGGGGGGEEEKETGRSPGLQCALVAYEYLQGGEGVQITAQSQHRLFMAAFLVAMKMYGWDDGKEVSNQDFAAAAGCALRDINWLELLFCTRVRRDFSFFVRATRLDELTLLLL